MADVIDELDCSASSRSSSFSTIHPTFESNFQIHAIVRVLPCTDPGVAPFHSIGIRVAKVVGFNELDGTYSVEPLCGEYRRKRSGVKELSMVQTSESLWLFSYMISF